EHFAIVIEPARGAHAVRELGLLAARAARHARLGHAAHPLRATAVAGGFGLPSLGNRHDPCLSFVYSSFRDFSAANRGSSRVTPAAWPQSLWLRSPPHTGHSPLQSSLQRGDMGRLRMSCSRTIGPRSICSPSWVSTSCSSSSSSPWAGWSLSPST